jgi:hypothetical protein
MHVYDCGSTAIATLAYSPEGELVVGTRDTGVLWLAAGSDPRPLVASTPGDGGITALTITPSGHLIAAAPAAVAILHPWHDPGPVAIHLLRGVVALDWLDEATILVGEGSRVRDDPGNFALWTLRPTFSRREPHFKEPKGVKALAVHRPTRRVAWATGHQRIQIWDPLRQSPQLLNLTATALAMAIHPDGQHIVAAQKDQAKIIDLKHGHAIATLAGHVGRITAVAYTPDGRHVLTGSWDQTLRIWDAATGSSIARYDGPTGRIACLAIAPDGVSVAAGGDSGSVVVWDLE